MKQFVLSAFADEAGSGIEEQISALERNQISMIEIRNIDGTCVIDLEPEELRRISTLLVSHGISVSAIASPIGKISIEEDFEAHRKRFEKAMEAAELLGKRYGLYTEKMDVTGAVPVVISGEDELED